MRAKPKIRSRFPAASWAEGGLPVTERSRPGAAGFVKHGATVVALQEAFSSLDRDERNKEQTQVVVQAFEPGRRQATTRTDPHLIIDLNLPRLHTANENESTPLLGSDFAPNHVFARFICQGGNLQVSSWGSGLKSGKEWLC